MYTKFLKAIEHDIKIAAETIKLGDTVVFPTETVYGLGANALDKEAVAKIFEAKGRPSDNPLIVHISDVTQLDDLVENIPEKAIKLTNKFWPGPLTVILKKKNVIPDIVTAGLDTVAVRMPNNKVALDLINKAGVPIAAPSANISGRPSPTTIKHALEDMRGRVGAIIEGDDCLVGVESTVIDMSGDMPTILRPGGITVEQIKEVIGNVKSEFGMKGQQSPKSPGMKYRHYAPNAEVKILSGSPKEIEEYIKRNAQIKKVGVLAFEESEFGFSKEIAVIVLGSSTEPEKVAKNLFLSLREMDNLGVECIYAPEISENGIWLAVKNRLYKAAGNKIIDVSKSLSKKRILFVCTGNTCRSPMAEGYLRRKIEKLGLNMSSLSAGIYAYGSSLISENSVKAMGEIGIDISSHQARQIELDMIKMADVILTMTKEQEEIVRGAADDLAEKVHTLSEYAGFEGDIKDPFGGSLEEYRECLHQITHMIDAILKKKKNK